MCVSILPRHDFYFSVGSLLLASLYEIQSNNCVVSLQSLCMTHLQAVAISSYT